MNEITVDINLDIDDAKELWHLLWTEHQNQDTRLNELKNLKADSLMISERQRRTTMATILSQRNMLERCMRAIRVKIPHME